MTEALQAVIRHSFNTLSLNRVECQHETDNPAAGRVMEKAGMKTEGVLRQSGKNNQGICDAVWHAMIRSDRE